MKMINLRMRPFKNNDTLIIKDWCKDEETFYKWNAGIMGEYPLTAEKMLEVFADRDSNDAIFPFIVLEENNVVGFFMFRRSVEDIYELRFCFVIVSPEVRGKGYGKEMIKLGIKFAKEIYGAKKLGLSVFENNTAAFHCYKVLGFVEKGCPEECEIMGRKWKRINMMLEL